MANSTINLNVKRKRPKIGHDNSVIRVSPKALNYLWDIYEECEGGSIAKIASTIIEQAVEKNMIRFLSEEDE